jgi:hypothetical protein
MSRSSNLGVWVVGAVALIALAVFGAMWLAQTTLLARIDGVSQESRRQAKKLKAKVGELQREIRELEARLPKPGDPEQDASGESPSSASSKRKDERIYVRITSKPMGARVRRGKLTIGRTPLVLPMGKSETATLLFSRRGYQNEEVTITGEDGNAMEVRLRRRVDRSSD